MSSAPLYTEFQPPEGDVPTLNQIKQLANKAAYDLLVELDKNVDKSDPDWNKWTNYLQVCTSESLTAGMILSTLVDIPWGGVHKYGGFGVYDTDAKRVFNGVSVDDVYTHRCAKEMAIGILKNSNATVAISVTGNAMPTNWDVEKLGEVFVGVAGYQKDGDDGNVKIVYETMSMNTCDNDIDEFKKTCHNWYTKIASNEKRKTFNPRPQTALISQEIRNYTTYRALNFCSTFLQNNKLIVPKFIIYRKAENKKQNTNASHRIIPASKYKGDYKEENVGEGGTPNRNKTAARVNTAQYNQIVNKYIPPPPNQGNMMNKNMPPRPPLRRVRTTNQNDPPHLMLGKSLTAGGNRSRRTHKSHRSYQSRRSRKH